MKAYKARLLSERYLIEGGAYGHLMHLYDNWNLTFGELKEVLSSAAEGKLEHATEKTDGMNLVFTYDASSDTVKAARSPSDIKSGGMDLAALASRWAGKKGREVVQEAFTTAFRVLTDAIHALPEKVRNSVFGDTGDIWYSMEVIYPANPNVINYDKNYIVFHAHGSFSLSPEGKLIQSAAAPGIELLSKHIDRMQNALSQRNWQLAAPQLVRLKRLGDGTILQRAIAQIEAAQQAAGVGDDGTIGDYMKNMMVEEVADLGLPPDAAAAVVSRALGEKGAPGLPQLKKIVPKDMYQNVVDFIKAADKGIMQELIRPIERAIHGFSVELLRGMQSVMVASHDAEVERIKHEVEKVTKAVELSGDVKAMSILQTQLQKLEGIENIAQSTEGIVFRFKGNVYKFTGSFAPVNQILGLFRYGRGSTVDETALKNLLVKVTSRWSVL